MEFVVYYPVSGGTGGAHADELAIGSLYSTEYPGDGILIVSDRIGIGTTNPQGILDTKGVDDSTSLVIFKAGADTTAAGTPEIRIGIGTDDPQEQLHLTGNIRLPQTSASPALLGAGIIYSDTETLIHSLGTSNTFVGRGTGNLSADASVARNVAIGSSALAASDNAGSDNVAVGVVAMSVNQTGARNVAVGYTALRDNTSGSDNTAVGNSALRMNTTGVSNVALGRSALLKNTEGDFNVAIGNAGALDDNTTGSQNIAIGQVSTLGSNTTGSDNIAIGSSLNVNETGNGNIAVGYFALINNTASSNTAVGSTALNANMTGTCNTAFGSERALYGNTTGSNNTGLGYYALYGSSTGSNNVAVGGTGAGSTVDNVVAAGPSSRAGNDGVSVGFQAGHRGTGERQIFVGYNAGYNLRADDAILHIDNTGNPDPLIYGEFDNDLVNINGNLGIGTSAFGTDAVGVLAIANGTAPSTSPEDQIQLYAEDVDQGGGVMSSELKVMDEGGTVTRISDDPPVVARLEPGIWEGLANITTLSPHNFTLIPQGPSEPMAWSFYSERGDVAINVDMLRAVRLIEQISGEHLVYLKDLTTGRYLPKSADVVKMPSMKRLNEQITTLGAGQNAFEQELAAQEEDLRLISETVSALEGKQR